MSAALLDRAAPIVIALLVMAALALSDSELREQHRARRETRRQDREWADYCQRRWQRVTTCTLAGQDDVARQQAAELRAAGIPDPRRVAVHR